MLQYAGLYPQAMELEGMALARAVDASNAIIANVERASLDVVLVTQGIPKIMRTVSVPEDMSEEARGGHTAGVLQRTVAYYENHNADQPIPPETPLFLVGPGGDDSSFRERVQSNVDSPLHDFAPALEYPDHLPLHQYAVNLGLALRALPSTAGADGHNGTSRLTINLAPPRRTIWRFAGWAALVLAIVSVGLAVSLFLNQRLAEASLETAEIQTRLTAVESTVGDRRGQLDKITGMEKSISQFRTLLAPQEDLTGIIAEMLALDVPGIKLTSVAAEPTKLTLLGSAAGPTEAIEFVKVLRDFGQFGEVTYKRVKTGTQNISISTPRIK